MKITVENYRGTQTKQGKAKKGHGWTKLEWIEMDCIWVNSKNVGPPFFKIISVYIKTSFRQGENHSQLLCGSDFSHVKAVFTSLNTAFLPISRSRFKRRQIPMLITLSTVWQFCVNFWVIFRCFGKERFFLKG